MFNAVKSGSIEAVDVLLTNRAKTDVIDEVSKFLEIIQLVYITMNNETDGFFCFKL